MRASLDRCTPSTAATQSQQSLATTWPHTTNTPRDAPTHPPPRRPPPQDVDFDFGSPSDSPEGAVFDLERQRVGKRAAAPSNLHFKINDFSPHDLESLPVLHLLANCNRPAHVQQVWRARESDFRAEELTALFQCLPRMCKATQRGDSVPQAITQLLREATSAVLRLGPDATSRSLAFALWAAGRLKSPGGSGIVDRVSAELLPRAGELQPDEACAVLQAKTGLGAQPSDALCWAIVRIVEGGGAVDWSVRNLAGFVVSAAMMKLGAWEAMKVAGRLATEKAEEATVLTIENLLWGFSMANVHVQVWWGGGVGGTCEELV